MKTKKRKQVTVDDMPTTTELARVVERQLDMLRSYKIRQDDIVRSLGAISKLIGLGAFEAAETAMKELMASDLAQAKERCDNHAFALDIAIKALENGMDEGHEVGCECVRCGDGGINVRIADAISKMRSLVPDAFKSEHKTTGPVT